MDEKADHSASPSRPAVDGGDDIRRRAEAKLVDRVRNRLELDGARDIDRLVHELGVHQIELEIQNDNLRQMQTALEASRDRYVSLYEEAPVGYVTLGLDGSIVELNRLCANLLGIAPGLQKRNALADYFTPQSRIRFQAACAKLLRERSVDSLELELMRVRSGVRWVGTSLSMVTNDAGVHQYRIAMIDISLRVALQAERSRLASIVATSDDAIISRDLDGKVVSWNSGAEHLLGFSADEMLGTTLDSILAPEDRTEDADQRMRLRHGNKVMPYETELRHRSGAWIPMLVGVSATLDIADRPSGSSMIGRDITDRKRSEEALHKRLRQLDVLCQAGQSLIMSEPDVPPLQHEVFDHVRLVVGAEIFLSYEVDIAAERLYLVSSFGLSSTALSALAVAPVQTSLAGIASGRRAPLVVENLQSSALSEARLLQQQGVRSFAGFPLLAHGKLYGVTAFASTTRDQFREGDLQVMQTVCDQVAAMLERSHLVDQLHQRENSLRLADQRKDDFIATLAHELRNPLAPIRNAVGILRSTSLPDPQLEWCRDVIERQVQHMTRLLEDLLDVSRVTRNKMDLRWERLDLRSVIADAVETTRPLIDSQRHELTVDIPNEPIVLLGDLARLTQVIGNLLNNAAKYTDAGGRIALTARNDGDEVRISVRDNGIGIDPLQVARVFDMFAQLKPALERSRGGLGIGLSLSRGIVDLHGGSMQVHSDGPGTGSEFIVRLPLVRRSGESTGTPEPEVHHARVDVSGRRVIIIDDNADAARTLATMLQLQGVDTRVAFGGKEGLAVIADWRPEAAIVDIGMPQLNGYEVCRRIRDEPWGERLMLIACTGWGQRDDRQRAHAAGFDAHLVKPIQPEEILRLLSRGKGALARAS